MWGYVVWGSMGVVVGVPEIWAAVDSDNVPWPTISGTVGYLAYWHDWVAIIVVAVLVWAAFQAIRAATTSARLDAGSGAANPGRSVMRAPGGRLTVEPAVQPVRALIYFPIALGVVVAGTASARTIRPDDKYLLGEVLYGLIGLCWIVIPGLLAYAFGRFVPYPTLFRTIQLLEQRIRVVAVVIAAGIVVLLAHLAFYPWPSIIPDLQDLHRDNAKQRHAEKKREQPSPYSP